MTWTIAKNPYADTDVVDLDALNDTMSRFAYSGNDLNEHNWAKTGTGGDTFLNEMRDLDQVDYGIALTPHITWNGTLGKVDPSSPGGNEIVLPTQLGLVEISSSLRDTIRTKGGMALVIMNFQLLSDTDISYEFAVGVDKVPRMDSILGSADGNNPPRDPAYRYPYGAGAALHSSSLEPVGPAISGSATPLRATWSGYLDPGTHVIELMCRRASEDVSTSDVASIAGFTMMILELWANP